MKKGIKILLAGIWLILAAVAGTFTVQAEGGGSVQSFNYPTVEVNIIGAYDYGASAKLFELLNAARQKEGLKPFIMDDELQDFAMQRAAERALYDSLERPNGDSYVTIAPDVLKHAREDGAINVSPQQYASILVKAAKSDPASRGILSEEYDTVGIGCFDQEGQTSMVLYLDYGGTDGGLDDAQIICDYRAKVRPEYLNLFIAGLTEEDDSLIAGKTGYLLAMNYNEKSELRGYDPFLLGLYADNFKWTFDDTSIISGMGTYWEPDYEFYRVKLLKPGTTNVHLTQGILRYDQQITVNGDDFISAPVLAYAEPQSAGTIRFGWLQVTKADGYRIYRKEVYADGRSSGWKNLKTIGAAESFFDDSTAVAGKNYLYTVRAYRRGSGKNLWSGYYSGIEGSIPVQVPKMVSAKAVSKKNIQVQWKKVPYASGYRVYRKVEGGKWQKLKTVNANVTSLIDTNADVATKYLYTVRAFYRCSTGNVWSYFENGLSARIDFAVPKLTSAKAITGKRIQVAWSPVTNATGYRVYRKTAGGSWKKLATISSKNTSFTDTTPVAGIKYLYTVRAYYKGANGNIWTGFESGLSAVALPQAPKLVGAKAKAYNAITVSWKEVPGVSGYGIFRKVPGGKWQGLKIVGASNNSYTDTTAVPGTKYYYTVRSYCNSEGKRLSGEYNKTGIAAVSNLGQTAVPAITAASGHSNKLSWKKTAGATGYQVYCKVGKNGKYQRIKVTGANSFTHTGLKKGTVYYYRVRAYRKIASNPNKYVYGAFSTEKYVTAK